MTFKEFIACPEILKALAEAGYSSPTPIQAQAIPEIKKGADLKASAQTGTGKTAAFLLPILERLITPSPIKGPGPRVLVLVPTRELAMQVAQEAAKYSKYLSKMKTVCIYGGAPYPPQNRDLAKPHEILVATPGRLIDHMQQGRVNFARLEVLVLDEADRMLDMGFIEAVESIAAATPPERQTLFFSATMKGSVLNLSQKLLKNPASISITPEHAKHELIEQRLHHVDNLDHKYRLLDHLLDDDTLTQAIVFTSTKYQADELADKLERDGIASAVLHGGMRQSQRTRTITRMRQGNVRVLVATDVAARGIDVPAISHVINFDLPNNVEDYVHRIGRTGRAGSTGVAFSFAAARDADIVRQIERFTGQTIAILSIPGFEAQRPHAAPRGGKPKSNKPFSRSNKKPSRFASSAKKKSFSSPTEKNEKKPFTFTGEKKSFGFTGEKKRAPFPSSGKKPFGFSSDKKQSRPPFPFKKKGFKAKRPLQK